MKTLLLFITLTLSLVASHIDDFAQEHDYYRDYNTSLAVAQKENKLIMLVMVADYCPWCRKMERKTLSADAVAENIEEHFIPMIVDRNKDKAHYPEIYDVPRIPTIFFINPKSEEHIFESIAYVKKDEFLQTLNDVLKMYKEDKE